MPFLINLIVGLVLSIGSTLLQQAFAPKQEQRTGTRGQAQLGGKVPQYFLVGTVGDAGKLEYQNSWGSSGGTPNAFLTTVLSFGDLPITALSAMYVNGTAVTLSETGAVTQGYPITTGDFANHVWWKFLDGSQTTADSYLTGKFGSDADRPWTSEMIGRGIPLLIHTAKWSEKVWTGRPTVVGQFQGIPLYDPRQDSTAGGSGSHRWADQSTWEFSDNSMVIIYNIERGIWYGGAHVWGGKKSAAQMPYAAWAAAMDACDLDIAKVGGGTEKQFRAGRRIALNERPADVEKEFLIGCNSRIVHCADGTVYPLVGVPDEADGSFSDADVLATEKLGTIPFPNVDDTINGATATYREPAQAWEDKETAPYLRSDLVTEDDGRDNIQGLDLATTFSGTQAQRVLKAVIEEGRRFRKHVVALPPKFAQFRPLHVLEWTSTRFDYTDKMFLITARTVDPFGNVVFGLQEIDPADHAWVPSEDEQPLSFAPVVVNRPPSQPMSGFAASAYTVFDAASNARRPGILLEYDGGLEDVRAVAWEVREDFGDNNVVATGEITYDPEEASPSRAISGFWTLSDTDYEVRAKFLPYSGRDTSWSSWREVTTPPVKLGSLDVDVAALTSTFAETLDWVYTNVRQSIRNFERLGTTLAEADLANFNEREALKRELRVTTGELEASFTEIIEVALGPGGAIATQLESLYAAMGGNTSEVNVRWETVAAPSGYSARYAITAAVNDETFRSATFFLDVPADTGEPTRIGFAAGQTVFFTSGGDPIAVVDEDGHFRAANGAFDLDMLTGAVSFTSVSP
jgi:hypothetical protein